MLPNVEWEKAESLLSDLRAVRDDVTKWDCAQNWLETDNLDKVDLQFTMHGYCRLVEFDTDFLAALKNTLAKAKSAAEAECSRLERELAALLEGVDQ